MIAVEFVIDVFARYESMAISNLYCIFAACELEDIFQHIVVIPVSA